MGWRLAQMQHISTHAPRAGSDVVGHGRPPLQQNFNPRSPCGERLHSVQKNSRLAIFQPTLPVRGATCASNSSLGVSIHFNPRSPCGERPLIPPFYRSVDYFNPRSPCGERQLQEHKDQQGLKVFQPTLPVRGATYCFADIDAIVYISTHAPRAGSDLCDPVGPFGILIISTHAPRAGSDQIMGAYCTPTI